MSETYSAATTAPSDGARELDWVVSRFVDEVPGTAHAVDNFAEHTRTRGSSHCWGRPPTDAGDADR